MTIDDAIIQECKNYYDFIEFDLDTWVALIFENYTFACKYVYMNEDVVIIDYGDDLMIKKKQCCCC